MAFKKIEPKEINENFIKTIGDEWMLVAAGDKEGYNMMTASWGFVGVMWGFPAAITAIRPQRYTKEFVDDKKYFTLSFYGDDKSIHAVCGKQSGRDVDKTALTGLKPIFDSETGAPYFDSARLVLICEKVYADSLWGDSFINSDVDKSVYPGHDYHTMYYGKILTALVKE